MPHGGPDWGTGGEVKTIYTIEDLGELAARLGSPVIFDRRGNVLWYDGFENGIDQWYKFGDPGYSVDWNSQYMKTGGFSCKLTTGITTNYRAWIDKYTGHPVLSSLGAEITFSVDSSCKYMWWQLRLYSVTAYRYAQVRYDAINKVFQYYGEDYNWHTISDIVTNFSHQPYDFHTVKFVIDAVTNKFKRIIVDDQEADLSTVSIPHGTNGANTYLFLRNRLYTKEDAAAHAYIDNIILTQNEP